MCKQYTVSVRNKAIRSLEDIDAMMYKLLYTDASFCTAHLPGLDTITHVTMANLIHRPD